MVSAIYRLFSFLFLYHSDTGCPRSPKSHGFFTQPFWMAVAPPIFVANNTWAHLEKPVIFWFYCTSSEEELWLAIHFRQIFCFCGCSSFDLFFGASTVKLVLELCNFFCAMFWCKTFDDWFAYDLAYDLFFENIMGKSKQKPKSAREPQLSQNSRADRNRGKQYVVHRMVMTSIESKTRGDIYVNVKKIINDSITVSPCMTEDSLKFASIRHK